MSLDLTDTISKSGEAVVNTGPLAAFMMFVICVLILAVIALYIELRSANKDARDSYRDFMNLSIQTNSVLEKVAAKYDTAMATIASLKGGG